MKINNFKKQGNVEEIQSTLTVSDVLIDTQDFLEYYDKGDYKKFAQKLNHIGLPDFDYIFKVIRKYKKFTSIQSLSDATTTQITQKRYDIRNAINTVIGVKDNFNDYRRIWEEIEHLTNQMYERTKDKILISEDVKKLKNNDLRLSEVNYQLSDLVKVMDRIGLIMIRFKQVQDELKETLLYLQDVMDEVSRTQSAVQLALDTGEMEKVFWKKDNSNIF